MRVLQAFCAPVWGYGFSVACVGLLRGAMSRQWSCATLEEGISQVDDEFWQNAGPAALAAYEWKLVQEMTATCLHIDHHEIRKHAATRQV